MDPKKLTLESLTKVDQFGTTPILYAAECGFLNQVPSQFITLETLTHENNNKSDAIQLSIYAGFSAQIPEEYMTIAAVTKKDIDGDTAMHDAVYNDNLKKLAKKFKTVETLSVKNNKGETPLEVLEEGFKLTTSELSKLLDIKTVRGLIPHITNSKLKHNMKVLIEVDNAKSTLTKAMETFGHQKT